MKYKHFFDKRSSLDIELPDIELADYPEKWYLPQQKLNQELNYKAIKNILDKQFKIAIELDDYKDNWIEGTRRSSPYPGLSGRLTTAL